jgi:hypothetical protein
MTQQEVIGFIQAALECSIYHSPTQPGLTYDEILEIGSRVGLQAGEIGDAVVQAATKYMGAKYLLPDKHALVLLSYFLPPIGPDFRNVAAFDFVISELNSSVKAQGARNAQLERGVVVERGAGPKTPTKDIEAAITLLIMAEQLSEKDGLIHFAGFGPARALPSSQLNQARGQTIRSEARARAYPLVRDVIERRSDARPSHTEPFDAFADGLDKLGYAPFRLWWKQIVAELRRGDTQSTPVSVSVLAAALVEGALTFVVKHARTHDIGVFGSRTFDDNPRTWRIDYLVFGAAGGKENAILDTSTQRRAADLIRSQQRIHAGRMLSEFPGGVQDLRPEEAREARTTAEMVVRRVLEWLEKHPASVPSKPSRPTPA